MTRRGMLILGWILVSSWCQQIGADEPIDKLIRQLDQPISKGRADAARQLAMRGTEAARATDALIRSLEDSEADTRVSAAYALGCVQVDSPRALTALLPLLTDSDEHVRYSAQWSIAQIAKSLTSQQDNEAVQTLTSTLRQASKEIRPREHQERHLIAIELALSRLEQLQPPKVITVTTPVPVQDPEELSRAKAMVESMYQATDAVGRFQFVRRLANINAYPDSLRNWCWRKRVSKRIPVCCATRSSAGAVTRARC